MEKKRKRRQCCARKVWGEISIKGNLKIRLKRNNSDNQIKKWSDLKHVGPSCNDDTQIMHQWGKYSDEGERNSLIDKIYPVVWSNNNVRWDDANKRSNGRNHAEKMISHENWIGKKETSFQLSRSLSLSLSRGVWLTWRQNEVIKTRFKILFHLRLNTLCCVYHLADVLGLCYFGGDGNRTMTNNAMRDFLNGRKRYSTPKAGKRNTCVHTYAQTHKCYEQLS